MEKKFILNGKRYLHFPIKNNAETLTYKEDADYRYVDVIVDGKRRNTFYVKLANKNEKQDFYAPYYVFVEGAKEVVLKTENVAENYFDKVVVGNEIEKEKKLYPSVKSEKFRQQFHFSPRVGWINDPNGLFFKDGVFNLYFQHNPFGIYHGEVHVSWGHAVSTDGLHWKEKHEAIYPVHTESFVASGTSFVDNENICGFGKGAVLSAHTELRATKFREDADAYTKGQYICTTKDGGDTFEALSEAPNISVPRGEDWRDPKLFEADGKLCLAVYERVGERNCISFYTSENVSDWKLQSRIMDMFECPDIFILKVIETGEKKWVLYSGDGKYRIGRFENFSFIEETVGGYLDYGICYAGQTFANYPTDEFRYHLAWVNSEEWCNNGIFYYSGKKFSQCLSMLCKLELHKSDYGEYYISRTASDNYKELRSKRKRKLEFVVCGEKKLTCPKPSEIILSVKSSEKTVVEFGSAKLVFDFENRRAYTPKGEIFIGDNAEMNVFIDKTTVEIFLNRRYSITFTFDTSSAEICVESKNAVCSIEEYTLKSIW